MFTSLKFGEKNDKLVDNIKKIQEQGEVRRRALLVTCEEFGIVNKSKLPIEDHADFDARVKELTEDMDQLDEISKKLAGRYVDAAARDARHSSHEIGVINGIAQTSGTSADDREYRDHHNKKQVRRQVGIHHALKRLTKEEVDPIVEAVVSKYIVQSILSENKGGSTVKSFPHSKVMKNIKDGYWEASSDVKPGKHVEIRTHKNKKATIYVDHDPVKQ